MWRRQRGNGIRFFMIEIVDGADIYKKLKM